MYEISASVAKAARSTSELLYGPLPILPIYHLLPALATKCSVEPGQREAYAQKGLLQSNFRLMCMHANVAFWQLSTDFREVLELLLHLFPALPVLP